MKLNIDFIYPIGSIYATTNTTSPNVLFGGTWERYAEGRCLVGYQSSDSDFGTIGKTGGEKTHTLTVSEMPAHNHSDNLYAQGSWQTVGASSPKGAGNNADWSHGTSNTGGGQAHNNLQPYIVVYYWRRTA